MKAQKINDNSRKPFNNAPLRDGEVLVPQLVNDRDYAIAIGAKPENFRTWSKGGVQYTVMFVPVPSEQEKNCQQAFDEAVNQYLDEKIGPNRHSRCMVPQPDGTYKPCPKIKNSNHVPCGSCQHRPQKGIQPRNP